MPKKKSVSEESGRLNLTLPPELNKRLNDYVIKYAQRHGKIPHAIRTKIARMAIEEWLDKNQNNFDIKF